MPDDASKRIAEIATDTSGPLIAADRVTGTSVYNRDGDQLGTVDYVMLDRTSGQAICAIMSFGGFLGLGESYHPLPWSMLTYNIRLGGYVVALDRKTLKEAPWHHERTGFAWTAAYGRTIDKYYGVASYWD